MEPAILHIAIPARPESPHFPVHSLTCTAWGNPAATPLLCMHGLTRNSRDFDFLAQAMAQRFYVVCPDMPGRGKSDRLPAEFYNYETYLADIMELVTQLNLSNIHWLGTSMGGIIGMMVANHSPGLIRSLILNDVGCIVPAAGLKRILGYAGQQMEFASRAEAEQHVRTICASFGVTEETHWQHLFRHGIVDLENGSARLHYDPAITAPLQSAELKDIDLWSLFDAIKPIPTLLIRGEDSDILLEETAATMAQNHPDLTRYNIANTGHAPALMAEEQISKIREWVEAKETSQPLHMHG